MGEMGNESYRLKRTVSKCTGEFPERRESGVLEKMKNKRKKALQRRKDRR